MSQTVQDGNWLPFNLISLGTGCLLGSKNWTRKVWIYSDVQNEGGSSGPSYWTRLILSLQSVAVHPRCGMILSISPSSDKLATCQQLNLKQIDKLVWRRAPANGQLYIKGADNDAKQAQWGWGVGRGGLFLFVFFKNVPLITVSVNLYHCFHFFLFSLIRLLVFFSVCALCSWL